MIQYKIMFVCYGNICRSPMAECILKDMVRNKGISDRFVIRSCATSAEEIENGIGKSIYPPAKAELAAHGITVDNNKRATQLQSDDYDKYDLFIGMDSSNICHMRNILNGDKQNKIHKLMDYTEFGGDVADPWFSRRFDIAFDDIYKGCRALLESLINE